MRGRAISITKLAGYCIRELFSTFFFTACTYYGFQIETAQFSSAQFGYPDANSQKVLSRLDNRF